MSAGAIYILDTDTGPMDQILQDGPPSEATLQREFGTERFVTSRYEGSSEWIVLIFVLIFALVIYLNTRIGKTHKQRKTESIS